jgi:hypothetical protein
MRVGSLYQQQRTRRSSTGLLSSFSLQEAKFFCLIMALILLGSKSTARAFTVRQGGSLLGSSRNKYFAPAAATSLPQNTCFWNKQQQQQAQRNTFSSSSLFLRGGADGASNSRTLSTQRSIKKNKSALKQTATTTTATEDASTRSSSTAAASTSATKILASEQTFLKPDRDNRQYRYIQLPNNLKVLLVSNPGSGSQVEAASIHVQAGHFDDTIPGLAHFHEHMLVSNLCLESTAIPYLDSSNLISTYFILC